MSYAKDRMSFVARRKQQDPIDEKHVRKAEKRDHDAIKKLIGVQTSRLFGAVSVREIMERCYLTLVLEDLEKNVIACIAVSSYPNKKCIPKWEWYSWLKRFYRLESISAWQTLFIHLVAWDSYYTFVFMKPLLKALFLKFYNLDYVILVMPPNLIRCDWLDEVSNKIVPVGCLSDPRKVETAYLMVRENFVTKYKIRKAVEEDNDDLVPLIHTHSTRLQEMYGSYYIAEILTRHPDAGRQIIVAEHDGHAVAVLCLNRNINYDLLNEQFELVPFGGLRKPDDRDQVKPYVPSVTNLSMMTTATFVQQEAKESSDNQTPSDESLKSLSEELESSITSYEKSEIELNFFRSETSSSDDFSLVDVSSVHLGCESDDESYEDGSTSLSDDKSNYSIVRLTQLPQSSRHQEMFLSYKDRSRLKSVSVDNLEASMKQRSFVRERESNLQARIPEYHGLESAFALEIAAANPEHEQGLVQLLEAAFQCFPDRDYCVLSLPSTVKYFPLLKFFVKVTPRPICIYEHELYVLHRNAISGVMRIEPAKEENIPDVRELSERITKPEPLMKDFVEAVNTLDGSKMAFMILNESHPVGAVVVTEIQDIEYIHTHYDVSRWINVNIHKEGDYGMIDHFLLTPAFHMHTNFILREIHRMSDFSVLYYRIHPEDCSNRLRERNLPACLTEMLPIKGIEEPEQTLQEFNYFGEPAHAVHKMQPAYSLYASSSTTCSVPRLKINTKVVVVGASDCAIAFLETLFLSWSPHYQATFMNVTVVSPHGLNYQRATNKIRDMLFTTKSHLTNRYLQTNCLRTYVNVICGVLTEIDRKEKKIYIDEERIVPYDYLFLFCGHQFQLWCSNRPVREYPENVFVVNTETDGVNALNSLRTLIPNTQAKYTVIVYGHNIEAYCCLAALLEYGIPGPNITFVEPFPIESKTTPPHQYSFFNNQQVDEAVQKKLREKEIIIYNSFLFTDWTYDKDQKVIKSAQFASKHRKIDLECAALFLYGEKDISKRTFLAINRAGLVYDGRLVIQPDCRTNDPFIYAAGTITKYSRKYYADHKIHRYYNMYEIGHTLGANIRKILIDECSDVMRQTRSVIVCRKGKMSVPNYTWPLINYCSLPGGLYYLSITKPGVTVPLITAMNSDDYGKVLVTGSIDNLEKGMFRLHVNDFNTVETITCLATFPIDRINLTSIWGKHVKLLNNVVERCELMYVTDLFKFFKQPWAAAIYHDKFYLLEDQLKDIMTSLTEVEGESLIEDLIKIFTESKWKTIPMEQMEEIEEKFTGSEYHKQLELMILEYIQNNAKCLPMYAHPLLVRQILQLHENSPFFRRQ